jgi:hypothetical protein
METDDDDDNDGLSVPAGPVRVTIGLMMMGGGVFMAGLIDASWAKYLGFSLFLISPFVMLKRPTNEK